MSSQDKKINSMKLSLKNFEKEAAAEIHKPEQVNDLLHTENDIAM